MEEKTKIKLKNAAEQTGAAVQFGALALVASALGPVVNTVWQVKDLNKAKVKSGKITMGDLREAIKSYAINFLPYNKELVRFVREGMNEVEVEGKKRMVDYEERMKNAAIELKKKEDFDVANSPEKLQESGVASILKLIDNSFDFVFVNKSVPVEYKKIKQEIRKLNPAADPTNTLEYGSIIRIGNVYISEKQHTAYINMSDGGVKMLVFPAEQYYSIKQCLKKRVIELNRAEEEKNIADFTAVIAAKVSANMK